MTARIAAALAVIAIALIIAACGGDGGVDVVSDEERQEPQDILDRESDGDAGLGDENSSDARDDTLDSESDGDARSADADADADADEGQTETFSVEGAQISIDVRDLPCSSDDGLVRTSDGSVGCVAAADLADIVSCGGDSRPILDLIDRPDDPDAVPFTACVPSNDTRDDVFEDVE